MLETINSHNKASTQRGCFNIDSRGGIIDILLDKNAKSHCFSQRSDQKI